MFIDSHCHLDFPLFDASRSETIEAARKVGVSAFIIPSIAARDFDEIAKLTVQFESIYGAFGLHPLFCHQKDEMEKLDAALARRPEKIVAVGEVGLDIHSQVPLDSQIALLNFQLDLAKKYQLPVLLHSRKTHDILYKRLKKAALSRAGIIHAFAGSYQQAMQFIELGYAIGVGGTITYLRAHKTRETIAKIPLTSIVLETDAPDMPVCGFQGQPNQPAHITLIFDALCRLRPESAAEIQKQIYLNTESVFGCSFKSI